MKDNTYVHMGFRELSALEQNAHYHARSAMEKARNYLLKRYKVGSTMILDNDELRSAFNTERKVVQACRCSEDNLFVLLDLEEMDDRCVTLVVVSKAEDPADTDPVPPCGSCRMIIDEYAERSGRKGTLKIIYSNSNFEVDGVRVTTIGKIYPAAYKPKRKNVS